MKLKTFLLTVLLLLGTMTTKAQEKQVQTIYQTQDDGLTKEELYEQIIKFGIKFPIKETFVGMAGFEPTASTSQTWRDT